MPCPNCDPDPVSRKTIKKITICQFNFFPCYAGQFTLLQKIRGKWRIYMIEKKPKLREVMKQLIYFSTRYTKNDFKIIKFNERHRKEAVDHRYRIRLTNNYDSYVPKSCI